MGVAVLGRHDAFVRQSEMKGINTLGQALEGGGFVSSRALVVGTLQSFDFLRFKRCVASFVSKGISHLAFPVLARD